MRRSGIWIAVGGSLLCASVFAAEGMWTLDNLPKARMQQETGFTPSTAFVERMMRASLRIAGGCSASFISPDGLVMTNHHCAASCVAQLSTAAKDFVAAGFLAKRREDEVRCPEIELNRLERITDVTEQVKRATAGLNGDAYKQAQNAVQAQLTSACVGADKATLRCDVVDLYHGGRYHLYQYHRFTDARLVWAPEKAVAFFGGDPDNFNFPRYDLDVSMLRAYENGKPAHVVDYFPFSKAGAAANELVFVTGHPGSTQRQLTMAQLNSVRDLQLIDGLLRLAEKRGVLEQYAKTGAEAARVANHDLFSIENGYKALYGRLQALLDPTLMNQKQADETALRRFVATQPSLRDKVGPAWDAIATAQIALRRLELPYSMLETGRAFDGHYFSIARMLVRGAVERSKPNAQRLPEFNDARLPSLEQTLFSTAPIYPAYEKVLLDLSLTKMRERLGVDHPIVQQVLGTTAPDQLAARMIDATTLGDPAVRRTLCDGGLDAVTRSTDPFVRLALALDPATRALRKEMEQEVESVVQKNAELIAQARFLQQGTTAYPDATFTLRLSYGQVAGWDEAGKAVAPFTTIDGAFARHTGAEPFALPASWLNTRPRLNPAQAMNLVSTNDIIGGNSGSPMINRRGEVVGLIFDGNIHSLGGAFGYDKSSNRAVAVDSGMLLEAMNKIYGAGVLADEITAASTGGAALPHP